MWVAARVPDGMITVHANQSRITTFPLDDPENWRYAPDVIDFAVKKGFYDPKAGVAFSFRDVYHPVNDLYRKRVCAGRVWSIYRRAAPDRKFPVDYFRGVPGAEDYPLFIRPTKKLSLADVMDLMRDHFEDTPYDMTQGIDAGPFASPYRWRSLTWVFGDRRYHWERPISSQQAAFVMVCQSRHWLPDPVGGVYWYTPDDAYTSCFAPFYCSIEALPRPYVCGDHNRFSMDSACVVGMEPGLQLHVHAVVPHLPGGGDLPHEVREGDPGSASRRRGDRGEAGQDGPRAHADVPDRLLGGHGGPALRKVARGAHLRAHPAQRRVRERFRESPRRTRLSAGLAETRWWRKKVHAARSGAGHEGHGPLSRTRSGVVCSESVHGTTQSKRVKGQRRAFTTT